MRLACESMYLLWEKYLSSQIVMDLTSLHISELYDSCNQIETDIGWLKDLGNWDIRTDLFCELSMWEGLVSLNTTYIYCSNHIAIQSGG